MKLLKIFEVIPNDKELSSVLGPAENGLGYFYCIDCVDCVKIGCSKNMSRRMAGLRKYIKENGKTIVRLAVSEPHVNYRGNEKLLHELFDQKRVRGTEFFNLSFDDFVLSLSKTEITLNKNIKIPVSSNESDKDILFGGRIKSLRTKCGWSQEFVARRMEVSRATIVNWEREKTEPTASEAIKLAKLFGITVEELMEE